MHLAERGRRHRRALKFRERLRQPRADFHGHDRLHFVEGERFHVILQPRQRLHVSRRHEVRARGDELAELDESRPELFQVRRQFLRLRRHRRRRPVVERVVHDRCVFHQIAVPILREEQEHVLVEREMFGTQRHAHGLDSHPTGKMSLPTLHPMSGGIPDNRKSRGRLIGKTAAC